VWCYSEPLEDCLDIRGYVAFYWSKVDAWFEENEQVFFGVKDPYTRVDCLRSNRLIEIYINSLLVAKTASPILLVETGLPRRFYIPLSDVITSYLAQNSRKIPSPYKGEAQYYDFKNEEESIEDIAWFYNNPIPEVSAIQNCICFPQGKVDMYVDGVLETRPKTRWD
jgi:uncharacterized protein (DUF427 family)